LTERSVKISVETILSQINSSINSKDFDIKLVIKTIGKYFNMELKAIVEQHENLAAKGIFGVRVPLRFSSHFV